jgi:uracil permease
MANNKGSMPNDGVIRKGDYLPVGKKTILGLQHVFTMFGATVLVPLLTGLNTSVALFGAGVGTLIFHFITKGKVPAFLGSSFAFIPVIIAVGMMGGAEQGSAEYVANLQYAQGGLVLAGIVYVILALIIKLVGPELITSLFPPIVTGPVIMVIGLNLAPTAIDMASAHWPLAIICLLAVTAVNIFGKGFIKVLPVISGLIVGYIVAIIFKEVDFAIINEAKWFAVPAFTMAKFDVQALTIIAPVAIVTMVEHIGDVLAISATVEEDFAKDPGIHRTLMGDGVATAVAGLIGAPANTTYGENTGVLALTKVWDPQIMRIAAGFAIVIAFIGKIGAIINTIPVAVVGGISIILFGMIAAIGVRTVVENQVDFKESRNLIIAAVILVLGIGGAMFELKIGNATLQFAGMALAAIFGIILNKVLPADSSNAQTETKAE